MQGTYNVKLISLIVSLYGIVGCKQWRVETSTVNTEDCGLSVVVVDLPALVC